MVIYREGDNMPKCPICSEEIYWVIVKGKVFVVPFSYTDIKSEKAELLKYNTVCGVYCPRCFGKLNMNSIGEIIAFFSRAD